MHTISLSTGLPVYIDATATATVTLLDSAGVEVVGQTWPTAFSYIAGSQGDVLAVLKDTLEVTAGEEITAHVVIDNGENQLGDWRGKVLVAERTF